MDIRSAAAADLAGIRRLLAAAHLDASDLETSATRLWVVGEPDAPAAVVGLETHGDVGLLRSLAVAEGLRGGGLGRALTDTVERHARDAGIRTLYLLTTTAADFFERIGYRRSDRAVVPDVIRATSQFSSLCPSSAVLMSKAMTHAPYNVLFLCTGNSARSILAEALMNHVAGHAGKFRAYSAGSQPKGEVHPLALELLATSGLPTAGLRSKTWDEFAADDAPQMDFVFTVCDNAANETCPVWPGHPVTAHWGVPDPAAAEGSIETRRRAFQDAFRALRTRIELFAELPLAKLDRMALQQQVHEIGRR